MKILVDGYVSWWLFINTSIFSTCFNCNFERDRSQGFFDFFINIHLLAMTKWSGTKMIIQITANSFFEPGIFFLCTYFTQNFDHILNSPCILNQPPFFAPYSSNFVIFYFYFAKYFWNENILPMYFLVLGIIFPQLYVYKCSSLKYTNIYPKKYQPVCK